MPPLPPDKAPPKAEPGKPLYTRKPTQRQRPALDKREIEGERKLHPTRQRPGAGRSVAAVIAPPEPRAPREVTITEGITIRELAEKLDVRAKDLGLLIVDEEQRFGVKQKELLRQLKLKVDVLSLSATPIPRTLQMSLAGLRDISVIETPPEGRRPVRTYVGEYDEDLVKQAIERELERGGQAFLTLRPRS